MDVHWRVSVDYQTFCRRWAKSDALRTYWVVVGVVVAGVAVVVVVLGVGVIVVILVFVTATPLLLYLSSLRPLTPLPLPPFLSTLPPPPTVVLFFLLFPDCLPRHVKIRELIHKRHDGNPPSA